MKPAMYIDSSSRRTILGYVEDYDENRYRFYSDDLEFEQFLARKADVVVIADEPAIPPKLDGLLDTIGWSVRLAILAVAVGIAYIACWVGGVL